MGHGLPYSTARGNTAPTRTMQRQVFTVRDVTLTVDGATGVGVGTVVIGDLPEGNIQFGGATAYMQFTGPTSAGLVDTWQGDYGIGTTPAGDATITGADVDIIPSTAIAAATAEASPRTRGASTAALSGAVFDNTDGSLELNLNLLIDDANISADGIAMTVNGELAISYMVLLDD